MTRKSYTANASRIPNRICPCCDENVKTGMPIFYVPNIYGTRFVDFDGIRPVKSVVIHSRCESVYDLSTAAA